jgi:osmotically-inducible protein OsmY
MKTSNSESIKNNIRDQLKWDDSVDASHVSVEVTNGNVFLQGDVKSYAEKITAARDAFLVPGVKHVENNLKVQFTTKTNQPGDAQINHNVIHALQASNEIKSNDIEVETNNQIVTLLGSVATLWEKYKAEDLANQTTGVLAVINNIEVNLVKTVEDLDIEKDIKNAYRRSPLIEEEKIAVNVHGGVVRLTGIVANYPTKKEALDIATYTKGVVNVTDELAIE